jgi:hypothetical protein
VLFSSVGEAGKARLNAKEQKRVKGENATGRTQEIPLAETRIET